VRRVAKTVENNFIYEAEFVTDINGPGARVIATLDHTGSLAAIVLNSHKVFHCQLLFYRPDSQAIVSRRLW
jgi:hypothetical protein